MKLIAAMEIEQIYDNRWSKVISLCTILDEVCLLSASHPNNQQRECKCIRTWRRILFWFPQVSSLSPDQEGSIKLFMITSQKKAAIYDYFGLVVETLLINFEVGSSIMM